VNERGACVLVDGPTSRCRCGICIPYPIHPIV
jgi:hypothetical protein